MGSPAGGSAIAWEHRPEAETTEPATHNDSGEDQVLRDAATLERQIKPYKRLTGLRLSFRERLGRLLAFRTAAIDAERNGCYRRADFLWERLHEQFAAVAVRIEDWQELADAARGRAAQAGLDGEHVRTAFVERLLLGAHWAFYRGGQSQSGAARLRCQTHLIYIRRMLTLPGLTGGEHLVEFQRQCKKEIAACMDAKRWKEARELSSELLSLLAEDEESRNLASAAWFYSTLDTLSDGKTEAEYLRDADLLKTAIDQLESTRPGSPHNILLLQRTAYLHFLRAVKLGNAQWLSEALLEVEKAVTFQPTLEDAWNARKQLIEMMTKLQEQVKTLLAEVASRPNARLTVEGERMRREAATGFRLINNYTDSEEAKQQRQDYRMAQALSIWKEMGFGALAADDGRPLELLTRLGDIFQAPPAEEAGLAAAWANIAASSQTLQALDTKAIVPFLAGRLFAKDQAETAPSGAPEIAAGAESAAGPMLVPGAPRRRWRDLEPFGYWLFTGKARLLKAELVAAVLVLIVAGALALRESSHRGSRDTAYARMSQATAAQDDLGTIVQAEAFLSRGVLAADPRDEEVQAAYTEALLRWVVSQNPRPDAVGYHLKLYRALVPERMGGRAAQ